MSFIIDLLKGLIAPTLAESKSEELQAAAAISAADPKQQQYSYDQARQSVLGDLSSPPMTGCQECMTNAKAARRKERLDLTNRALSSCPEHAEQATRLRQDMDEVENMRCAKQVYIDENDESIPAELRNPPPGFLRPSEQQLSDMGLTQEMLTPSEPDLRNFKAAVYMKDPAVWGESPQPPSVIAFRGSTPALEDWQNNFAQDANREAPYYKNAVTIGKQLKDFGANTQIVGHSLGGGLASAAQGASGFMASTYNSAGLHPNTVPRYLADLGEAERNAEIGKINAIRVDGEVLTQTQEQKPVLSWLANQSVGQKRDIPPALSPSDFKDLQNKGLVSKQDDYPTYLHGMDQVIDATEQQKTADEATLKNCVNRGQP